MSIKIMSLVLESSGLSMSEKMVALILADHAHDDGHEARPGVARMAKKASLSERQVQRNLSSLVEKGVIYVEKYEDGGRMPRWYAFDLSKFSVEGSTFASKSSTRGDMGVTPEELRGDMGVTPGVTSATLRGDMGVTLTINEPSNNHHTTSTGVDGAPEETASSFEAFWESYPRKVAKQVAHGKFKAAFKKAKKCDLEELMSAVENYKRQKAGTEKEYLMHPSTFLSKGRWKDYVPEVKTVFPDSLHTAEIYESYDRHGAWRGDNGEAISANPAMLGYYRPLNDDGNPIDINGRPYKITAQGSRKYLD